MTYGILFEQIQNGTFPGGHYYAHIPSLGLTTHGDGVSGAREAAFDLLELWIAEKRSSGESLPPAGEFLLSTIDGRGL